MILKGYWPFIWYVDKAKTQSLENLEKNRGIKCYLLCYNAFSPTIIAKFSFYLHKWIWFIN